MSFKCLQCEIIVHDKENRTCTCESPKFAECADVHYLHEEGPGKGLCKQKTNVGIPGTESHKVVNTVLRQGCTKEDVKVPIASRAVTQVTCPDCLRYIQSLVESGTLELDDKAKDWLSKSQPKEA